MLDQYTNLHAAIPDKSSLGKVEIAGNFWGIICQSLPWLSILRTPFFVPFASFVVIQLRNHERAEKYETISETARPEEG
jgi:hypothetical protein